jgi:hypothetical protein
MHKASERTDDELLDFELLHGVGGCRLLFGLVESERGDGHISISA